MDGVRKYVCVRLIQHIDAGFIFQKIRGAMILEQNKGAKQQSLFSVGNRRTTAWT